MDNTAALQKNHIVIRKSAFTVRESIDLLQSAIVRSGGTVYNRIDQQSEVGQTGINLLPTEFLLFGNPAIGGDLMRKHPLTALDLPLKIIAWEDINGEVWLAFNDIDFFRKRHRLQLVEVIPLDLDHLVNGTLKK